MYRGVEMMTTGETTDSKGRKLFDTTFFGEGLVKFLILSLYAWPSYQEQEA